MAQIKCEIHVKSTQTLDGEVEVSEEVYQGTYLDRGHKKYLSYARNTEDGAIECLLTIEGHMIIMSQHGIIDSRLSFILGKKTSNPYHTPLGEMNIPVYTRGMSIHDKKESIEIMLDYDIATEDAIRAVLEIEANCVFNPQSTL